MAVIVSHALVFDDLESFESSDPTLYRIYLDWNLSDVFLMIRLECPWEKKAAEQLHFPSFFHRGYSPCYLSVLQSVCWFAHCVYV